MVMKILISIGTLGLGGAEKQAVWLANRLAELHEVTLLTYHGGVREKDLGPKVIWRTIYEIQDEERDEDNNSQGLIIEERALPQSLIKMESNPFYEVGSRERESVKMTRFLWLVRQSLLYLTLSRLRQNIKNQTFAFRKARKELKRIQPDLIITFLFHDTVNIGLAAITQVHRPNLDTGSIN